MAAKVGSIVLATEQGLGYLAKDFFDNGIIHNVSIHQHGSRTNHWEWYPRELAVSEGELLETCDTLLFFETPFNWKIIPQAREKGIKTALMVMYECTRYPFPYEPDLILCPSLLDLDYYKEKGILTPVPVNVGWRQTTQAKVFVHNAGNGGIGGRNGTRELLEAMQYVKSPIKLIIRSQQPIKDINDSRVEIRVGSFEDIWSEGDVFVFPEKFNGLSLPLQEAFASGMAVIAGDRHPINTWLPKDLLIPVKEYRKEKIAVEFQSAVIDPRDIASKIDEVFNTDITRYSLMGKEFAKQNSWQNLKEVYETLLSQ